MQFSYSRVNVYNQCPFKFKLSYIDNLKVIQYLESNEPVVVGKALHLGIETDEKTMIDYYYNQFNVITDKHINEVIKLKLLLKKVNDLLVNVNIYKQEFEINNSEFKGIVDLITLNNDGTIDIFDFKYSNSIDYYKDSGQLHIYKYYLEKMGFIVNRMGFIFIPKTGIRQKKSETLYDFRNRLIQTVINMDVTLLEVKYNVDKVNEFLKSCNNINSECDYKKIKSDMCKYCDFKKYCMEGFNYMLLPKNEKRKITSDKGVKIWVYAPPFAGKSYLANQFPDALFLNTDGNVKFINSPSLPIKDDVKIMGRIKQKIWAWDTFKNAVDEIIAGEHEFKTIVVDLLDDVYESARLKKLSDLGVTHESDAGYGKGHDQVRTEFLPVMRKLTNTDYNIIFISHEIVSEINKPSGEKITTRNTPLPIKVANKLAGMVDIVARIELDDCENRLLKFKSSPTEFGGGRLNFKMKEMKCNYDLFMKEYVAAVENMVNGEVEINTETRKSRI